MKTIWYFYFACPHGCSYYIEHTAPDPPPGWETFTCRYHDVPLTSFQPQDVPS